MDILISRGAAVDAGLGKERYTALECPALHGRLDILQLLLSKGAKTDGAGLPHYFRAIRVAQCRHQRAAAELLMTCQEWTELEREIWGEIQHLSPWRKRDRLFLLVKEMQERSKEDNGSQATEAYEADIPETEDIDENDAISDADDTSSDWTFTETAGDERGWWDCIGEAFASRKIAPPGPETWRRDPQSAANDKMLPRIQEVDEEVAVPEEIVGGGADVDGERGSGGDASEQGIEHLTL